MSTYHGKVLRGTKRGTALGFPTANITLDDTDVSGVYVARATFDDKEYPAAAFADRERGVLEAYILDADLDLYGKEISVELLKKIRGSTTFENDTVLRAAIANDIAKVRAYFKAL